jgi:hypothetical protein
MPWKASSVMEERLRFVARLLDGEAMTDVCRDNRLPALARNGTADCDSAAPRALGQAPALGWRALVPFLKPKYASTFASERPDVVFPLRWLGSRR